MKLVVCVDDNFGILFNKRRQSSDKMQRMDLKNIVLNSKVYLSRYSYDLYKDMDFNFEIVDENMVENIHIEDDSFFIYEGEFLEKFIEKVDEIICYFWNRDYPFDKTFDILDEFKEISRFDFKAKSHDKIERKIYVRK